MDRASIFLLVFSVGNNLLALAGVGTSKILKNGFSSNELTNSCLLIYCSFSRLKILYMFGNLNERSDPNVFFILFQEMQ